MSYRKLFTMLFIILIVSGCSSTEYRVEYNSVPNSGMLYCNGKPISHTPATRSYPINDKIRKSGVLIGDDCYIKWVSGAVKKTDRNFDLKQFPDHASVTTDRPNTPGYQNDAEFALKVQALEIEKVKAAAQAEQASAATSAAASAARSKTCYGSGSLVTCF